MHEKNIEKNEYSVFQDILRLDPDAFQNQKTYLDIHKEMQHYCELSRVIDITTQALAGLFFAVGELTDRTTIDPVVFMFAVNNNKLKRPESDGTQIKLALSTIKDDRREELKNAIKKYKLLKKIKKTLALKYFNQQPAVQKLCYSIRKNDGVLFRIEYPEDIEKIEFVLPNMNNKRIIAQQGAFIAVGLLNKDEIYNTIIDFLKKKPCQETSTVKKDDLMMIEIDWAHAYDIKLELEQLGITKSVMYPDIQKIGEYFKKDLYLRGKKK